MQLGTSQSGLSLFKYQQHLKLLKGKIPNNMPNVKGISKFTEFSISAQCLHFFVYFQGSTSTAQDLTVANGNT